MSSIKFTDNSGKVLRAFDAAMDRALGRNIKKKEALRSFS